MHSADAVEYLRNRSSKEPGGEELNRLPAGEQLGRITFILASTGDLTLSREGSFVDLVERLRKHDTAAAEEVFRRSSRQLVRLAEPRLAGVLRRKIDAEDVVQSAF